MRVADAELPDAVFLIDWAVDDLGAPPDELVVQGRKVVDIDVDVEHVGWCSLTVWSNLAVLEAGKVDAAGVPRRVGVVLGEGIVKLDVEAKRVSVVAGGAGDAFHEKDGRMARRDIVGSYGSGCSKKGENGGGRIRTSWK